MDLAVIAAGPKREAVFRIHQLHRNPHLIFPLAHASFEQCCDSQPPGDFAAVHIPRAELEGRSAGGDLHAAGAAKRVDDFFAEAVAEIGLIIPGTHVGERQHRDRRAELQRGAKFPRGGTRPPGVEFGFKSEDRAGLVGAEAANRQAFFTLPALHRAGASLQIGGHFFPGVEPVFGGRLGRMRHGWTLRHVAVPQSLTQFPHKCSGGK